MFVKNQGVIRHYTNCLYDVCTKQQCLNFVFGDLQNLCKWLTENKITMSSNLSLKIILPFIGDIEKKLKINTITKNFLLTLAHNKRFFLLPEICKNFEKLHKQNNNIVSVVVRSASALKVTQRRKIKDFLESMSKKEINIDFETDAGLIGGFLIQNECKIIDLSLKARLHKFDAFMKS